MLNIRQELKKQIDQNVLSFIDPKLFYRKHEAQRIIGRCVSAIENVFEFSLLNLFYNSLPQTCDTLSLLYSLDDLAAEQVKEEFIDSDHRIMFREFAKSANALPKAEDWNGVEESVINLRNYIKSGGLNSSVVLASLESYAVACMPYLEIIAKDICESKDVTYTDLHSKLDKDHSESLLVKLDHIYEQNSLVGEVINKGITLVSNMIGDIFLQCLPFENELINSFHHLLTSPLDSIDQYQFVYLTKDYIRTRRYLTQVLVGDGTKAYCPFVKMIEKNNGYYLQSFNTDELSSAVFKLEEAFKSISASNTHKNQKPDPVTVVAMFPATKALSEEFCKKLEEERNRVRLSFLVQGLMIAHMHPYHELGSAKESSVLQNEVLYVSGIPLLMVRRMHKEDWVFMHEEKEKLAYAKYFGKVKPKTCPFHFS